MRIEIEEVPDRHVEAWHEEHRAEISHLNDDHHGPGHERPTAAWQSQLLGDAEGPDRRHRHAAADRDAPAMLTRVHVDGDDAAEWRLEQRQSARSPHIAGQADEVVSPLPRLRLADLDEGRNP